MRAKQDTKTAYFLMERREKYERAEEESRTETSARLPGYIIWNVN
jgi:hypothetical protein